jgi:predicted CopG family antitoxin
MSDEDEDDDVNIRIKRDTWHRLHNRKEPNDSFDDVIRRVLDQVEEGEEGNPKTATAD